MNHKDFNHWHQMPPPPPQPEDIEPKREESTAKQINNRLDEIIKLKRQIKVTKNKESLLAELEMIKGEINKITNNGTQIIGTFNNLYYINDFMQDKNC
jgi:hypothetical protein